MAIILSKNAAQHIQLMLDKRGYGLGLRLSTRLSGCSGFSYVVDYADTTNDDDLMYEQYGVKVFINKRETPNLDGIEIDFLQTNLINKGFEFNNPNIKNLCGCGESFNV